MPSSTSSPESIRTPEPGDSDPAVNDTIVAIATPPGRGGISIVRLSGPAAVDIAEQLAGAAPPTRFAGLRFFRNGHDEIIDQGLLLLFAPSHSYTGEAVAELHAHGSPVVAKLLVDRCLELGARMARPGEFSERAFLCGQLDLAQAEAVADLIESSTEAAARSAMTSLQGEFSRQVHGLAEQLNKLRIYVEAAIDFPEEEIDFLADSQITSHLVKLNDTFDDLRSSMQRGRLLRDGLRVVLVGAPNAGKSSLLNRLSREQRAIVSDIPGTTRDVLEHYIDLGGLPVMVVDTAGLRHSGDVIEAEGVRRALAAQQTADLVLHVRDCAVTTPEPGSEPEIALQPGQSLITVYNKIDLAGEQPRRENGAVYLSALTGAGMDLLVEAVRLEAGFSDTESSQFIARQRHIDALDRARRHLQQGIEQLRLYQAGELLAEELRLAQQALGEITGEVTSDDLLGMIFSSFCIGK